MNFKVIPVTEEHAGLLASFFATSPGVNGCWCMWPLRPSGSHHPDESKNKEAMESLLRSGISPGLICLKDNQVVGWCALGERNRYPQYGNPENQSNTWTIPCIFIQRNNSDRKAIARTLIESAMDVAKKYGANILDGPPPWWNPGDADAIARATELFIDNGFTQIARGARMPVLRREIQ